MAESFNPILGFDNRATPAELQALVFAIESFIPLAGGRIERVARFGDERRRVLLGTVVNICSGKDGYSVRVVDDRRDLLNVVAWPDHVHQRAPVDPEAREVMWEVMQPHFATPDTLPANYLLDKITSQQGLEGVPCAAEANAFDHLICGAQPTTTAYASKFMQIRPGYEVFASRTSVLEHTGGQGTHTYEVSITSSGGEDFCAITGLEGGIPGVAVEQVTGKPLRNPGFRTSFQVYGPDAADPVQLPYIPGVYALSTVGELLVLSSDQNNPGITL